MPCGVRVYVIATPFGNRRGHRKREKAKGGSWSGLGDKHDQECGAGEAFFSAPRLCPRASLVPASLLNSQNFTESLRETACHGSKNMMQHHDTSS